MADPLVNTMSTPNNNKIMMRGSSQNFFLTFKNPHKSFRKSIYLKLIRFFNF